MKTKIKRLMGGLLTASMMMSLVACGSSEASSTVNGPKTNEGADDSAIAAESPYAGKGFNFSTPETVVMYVLGDRPADMDTVLEKANSEYFEPNLNTHLNI